MTETISDHSDPDPETTDRARAALSAEDAIEKCRTTGIDAVEYARTKYGVDPAEYSSRRSLRKALYPDREAELAEREPSDAAKGARMLVDLEGGKSFDEASREVSASLSEESHTSEADSRARAALGLADVAALNESGLSPAEYVSDVYGEDASSYRDDYTLRDDLRARQNDPKVESRRSRFRQANEEREAAQLRERVQRDTEAKLAEQDADQLAFDALAGTPQGQRMHESPRSNAAYTAEEFGVDPREFDEPEALRDAIDEADDT